MSAPAADVLAAVAHLGTTPTLAVACDFDGVLAPLVDDPMDARALPSAVDALRVLAGLPATHVAVVSGRSREVLGVLALASQLPDELDLIGSHGWEDAAAPAAIGADERARHDALVAAAQAVAGVAGGVRVEIKPASVTVHYRSVAPEHVDAVLAAIEAGPAQVPGAHVLRGKAVVEFAVVRVDKGVALERLRGRVQATAAFFIGDDVTDERAFAVLRSGDVGVKVGQGDTLAGWRVDDPDAAAEVLLALAAARAAHVRD